MIATLSQILSGQTQGDQTLDDGMDNGGSVAVAAPPQPRLAKLSDILSGNTQTNIPSFYPGEGDQTMQSAPAMPTPALPFTQNPGNAFQEQQQASELPQMGLAPAPMPTPPRTMMGVVRSDAAAMGINPNLPYQPDPPLRETNPLKWMQDVLANEQQKTDQPKLLDQSWAIKQQLKKLEPLYAKAKAARAADPSAADLFSRNDVIGQYLSLQDQSDQLAHTAANFPAIRSDEELGIDPDTRNILNRHAQVTGSPPTDIRDEIGSAAMQTGNQIGQGTVQTVQGLRGAGAKLLADFLDQTRSRYDVQNQTEPNLSQKLRSFAGDVDQNIQQRGGEMQDVANQYPVQSYLGRQAVSAGASVPTMVAAMAGPEVAPLLFGAQGAGQTYAGGVQAGDENAASKALYTGIADTLLMRLAPVVGQEQAGPLAQQIRNGLAHGWTVMYAQNVLDQAIAKAGTDQKVDLVEPIMTSLIQAGVFQSPALLKAAGKFRLPTDSMADAKTAEPGLTRPGTMQTPEPQAGDYGGGLRANQPPEISPPSAKPRENMRDPIQTPEITNQNAFSSNQNAVSSDQTRQLTNHPGNDAIVNRRSSSPENPNPTPVDQPAQPDQPAQNQPANAPADHAVEASHGENIPETGKPFTTEAYRGSAKGDPSEVGPNGIFFSPDPNVAKSYAGPTGRVTKETVSFTNPLVADNWVKAKEQLGLSQSDGMAALTTAAADAGHDGIVFNRHNGKPEFVKLPSSDLQKGAPNGQEEAQKAQVLTSTPVAKPGESAPGAATGVEPSGAGELPTLTEQSPEAQAYFDGSNPRALIDWLDTHDPKWQELRNAQDGAPGDKRAEQTALHSHLNHVIDTLEGGGSYAPETRNISENSQPEHQGTESGGVSAASGGSDSTARIEDAKPAGKPKSKAALERLILDHYNQTEGTALDEQAAQDERAQSQGWATTFKGQLPEEVRNAFTGPEIAQMKARGIIRVIEPDSGEPAHGEDVMHDYQRHNRTDYVDMLRRRLDNTGAGRLRAAVKFAEKSRDPEVRAAAEQWREQDAITQEKADYARGKRKAENNKPAVVNPPADVSGKTPEPPSPKEAPGEVPPPEAGDKSPTSVKNRIVDQERQARGLEPMMAPARKEFGKSWDNAARKMDENPQAANDLIEELKKKPRALNDEDVAMLLRRKIELRNERDKVQAEIIDAAKKGEEPSVELRQRLAGISDGLLDIDNVGKKGGTESARGLAIRRMMAKEDFSLAAMETAKRAANGGKELTEAQSKQIADLNEKLTAKQKEFDDYVAKQEKRTARAAELKAKSGYGSKNKIVSNDAYQEALRTLRDTSTTYAGLPLDKVAALVKIGAYHVEAGARSFAAFAAKMKEDLGDSVEPYLKDVHAQALDEVNGARKEAGTLKGVKTRATNRINDLADRIANEDYSPNPPRKPMALDAEATRLKAEVERLKQQFQTGLMLDRLKNRTRFEKGADLFAKWRRAGVLSSPVTIAKLASAAAQRMVFSPIEELVGGALSKVPGLRRIAANAPRQGGFSVKAEAKAVTSALTSGMKDAWEILRTGKSDSEVLNDKADHLPRSWLDFMGTIHSALKAPVKRAEFERSLQRLTESAIANGVDTTDPMVQMRLMKDSYVEAQKSIFMQDNKFATKWNQMIEGWERPDKVTGKAPIGGKIAATTARTLLPIVKVPTNIIGEAFKYALGLPAGTLKAFAAHIQGINTLTPQQADAVMSLLKKGSLGAGMMALGYFGASGIGGFHQSGEKRDKEDAKPGTVRLFGKEVPSYLLHNPTSEAAQVGATIRRVADAKLKKSDADVQGVGAGSVAAAMGLIEEVPFVQEAKQVTDFADAKARPGAAGRLAESIAVPAAVQFAAKHLDKKDAAGEPVKRKPEGVLENVKMGVPGLRQQVPEVPEHIDRVKSPGHERREAAAKDRSGELYGMPLEKAMQEYGKMNDSDKAKYERAIKQKIDRAQIAPAERRKLRDSLK